MNPIPRPFWPPHLTGAALGLTLIVAYILTGHGVGAHDFFSRAGAAGFTLIAPAWAEANRYLAPYLDDTKAAAWMNWQVAGLVLGALMGSLSSGRFRPLIERGAGFPLDRRLGWAFAGGLIVGLGMALARGSIGEIGISSGSTLAVAGFVFLIAFFATGFAVMPAMKRRWQ